MARVIIAATVAMVLSIVLGPQLIEFLRRRELGQHIREEGPQQHIAKQGTPTMGGILVVVSASLAFLALGRYTTAALTVVLSMLLCGAIGFLDDFIKLRHRRSLGLAGRWKLLMLAGTSALIAWLAAERGLDRNVYIPVADWELPLSWLWYPFLFLVVAGAANGVNLTDGIDGLAAGTGTIAIFTFTVMGVYAYVRSGQVLAEPITAYLDLAILGGALIGAVVGFLWYNAFPAEVFMGDTGAMAIGGALAGFAIMMETEVLLLLLGGIFVVEALSVAIQVLAFQRFRKRVFLMAPVHHHFELLAWSETKIILRFWIVAAICSAIGFTLYQQSVK